MGNKSENYQNKSFSGLSCSALHPLLQVTWTQQKKIQTNKQTDIQENTKCRCCVIKAQSLRIITNQHLCCISRETTKSNKEISWLRKHRQGYCDWGSMLKLIIIAASVDCCLKMNNRSAGRKAFCLLFASESLTAVLTQQSNDNDNAHIHFNVSCHNIYEWWFQDWLRTRWKQWRECARRPCLSSPQVQPSLNHPHHHHHYPECNV